MSAVTTSNGHGACQDGPEEDFIPRAYQVLLLEKAMLENTIVYLPTGSGKTFVAIMLIKALAKDIEKPYDEGGKRTFFMVNTVALVHQQAQSIQRMTPFSVGQYSGDMNVDYWTKDRWQEELQKHEIMVMTSQIFLDMLLHSYVHLSNTNLLIFDECHHGVNDHPMRLIMQRFETCSRAEQPRVLGLSATLILGSIKRHQVPKAVHSLETTFHSKVATIDGDHVASVTIYSTNPRESIDVFADPASCPASDEALRLVEKLQTLVANTKWPAVLGYALPPVPSMVIMNAPDKRADKVLKNLLSDLVVHVNMLGVFGGSRACLAHLINLERRRMRCEDQLLEKVHTQMITGITLVNQCLMGAMEGALEADQIKRFSSDKVLRLIHLLRHYYDLRQEDRPFCAIIFVQRRYTAKVVYHILQSLKAADPANYDFLRADFVVGLNQNPMHDTRAGRLAQKHNSAVIQRFNAGATNIVVSSDVLEEGIDVPLLSLVIKFDLPSNHSSYIQSKGRARHPDSHYVVMVSQSERSVFSGKYLSYQEVERELKSMLVGRTDSREAPTAADVAAELYDQYVPPYYAHDGPKAACVTLSSAVQLVNRYCSMLPQDKFTTLVPSWFYDKRTQAVSIQLPMSSPLKELVTGLTRPVEPDFRFKPSKKFSKRSAALETCKRLHQMGELNEKLLPIGNQTAMLEDEHLFPHWEVEGGEEGEAEAPKPGTNKMIRTHVKKFPECLSKCCPQPDSVTYMYRIGLAPNYEKPTVNRRKVFYDLLSSDRGYAILTSKKLPQVCEFSIYLNVGEVRVSVQPDGTELELTAAQVASARRFNAVLFNEVLRLEKAFLVHDVANLENAYVVVPTADGRPDWAVMEEHVAVPEIRAPGENERKATTFDGLLHTVVAPWYRGSLRDMYYVVTQVCDELSPQSRFPSEEMQTYEQYFARKYSTSIVHPRQPLIEVKTISMRMHCIRPRLSALDGGGGGGCKNKRKRQELNEDFEEHLVPELCARFHFPAVLWLKATCLPTVLHRLVHLLLAEELRAQIAADLSVGVVSLPPGVAWQPLVADPKCTNRETKPETLLGIVSAGGTAKPLLLDPDSLWGGDREPVDIDRMPLDKVRLVEIQYFENFVSKPLPPAVVDNSLPNAAIPVKKIALLSNIINGIGPQQFEIFQALTATTANDVVNLERSETLGDSFLKLSVTQFLYREYSGVGEGALTGVKGKLVGNRNLYYCGKRRGLPAVMKVADFSPASDFLPPGMCVPRYLRQLIELSELSPNVLFSLSMPRDERLRGQLSENTVVELNEQIVEAAEDVKTTSTMEVFLGRQTVKDKTVADGVESLIGAYLKSCGVRGALLLLGWLGVLPADKAVPEHMYDARPPTALLCAGADVDHHLRACNTLEERIGYRFKDRSFLLQALTHPSYEANRMTESYQRLEFLGDALLDFLVTCHIYEAAGSLTPGQLTDLRSSLVNNVYFASLVARLGLHQFLLMSSPRLLDAVDKFVRYQEERNHVVSEQVLYLVGEVDTDPDVKMAECIDVPKVLGDLFESLAGAIYLDSGKSLEAVWDVYYRLMHKEITEFTRNVPKQPVRLLYERLGQNKPVFHKTKVDPETGRVSVDLEITVNGQKSLFRGFGENKVLARTAAAKIAMKQWLPT